ncbi:MAG: c-type cytochrome domain-containing protein [Ginsengibacter sp.]
MFLTITEFFGHFHPLIVHLPIGILLIALLFKWLPANAKYQAFKPVVPFLLLCGMVSAIFACITGYLLSISDDYNETIVGWHKWMGITVAVTSILLYAKEKNIQVLRNAKFLSLALFILIMITGHLGGLLTHGSDYLTRPLADIFENEKAANTVIKPVPDVQQAVAYSEVIRPILQTRCYSCHGPNKQKGGLRMDDSLKLLKGGKDGIVIDLANVDSSEMIKRLLLPVDNQDHMPPKEKPQPTESQVTLLHWWIANGANFTKKVKDLHQPEKIKPVLLALQDAPVIENKLSFLPVTPVEKADTSTIDKLKDHGIIVLPVADGSNYLSANFVTDTLVRDADIDLLLSLKKQLVWLKLGFTELNDEKLAKIGQLHNLTKLSMEHTAVTDNGIQQLRLMKKLQYLNLVGTGVTDKGLLQLKDLKELHSIYVYLTKIVAGDWQTLTNAFPQAKIDSGGYMVPILASDTTEVKVAKKD